jgi:tRNA-Thr(GGU) m(6)t(6)A37 methyltransferase TsaA
MQPILLLIGVVHSHLKRLEDCPLQESENAPQAILEIFPEYIKGIKDIKKGDQLLILTWLHKSDRTVVATHPRNDPAIPLTGVFSTRSPDRPNPIGLHAVEVVSILDAGMIKVSGLEVLDQTPLIDIKPILKPDAGT